jgi:hypothetical protein
MMNEYKKVKSEPIQSAFGNYANMSPQSSVYVDDSSITSQSDCGGLQKATVANCNNNVAFFDLI